MKLFVSTLSPRTLTLTNSTVNGNLAPIRRIPLGLASVNNINFDK
jgi:hypothetical protein